MELYEVYNHLDSIASYCRSMIEEPGDIWCEDLIACRIAQACVGEIMEGMKEDNEQNCGAKMDKGDEQINDT